MMQSEPGRLKTSLYLAGALGLAALSQLYFFARREYVWDGVIFMALALFFFARLTRSSEPTRPRPPAGNRRQAVLIGLALLLNLVAARSVNTFPPPTDYTFSVLLWLASMALFWLGATGWAFGSWGFAWLRKAQRLELTLVLVLLLSGFALRAWDLEHIPANLGGDEGTQGMAAVDVLEGRLRNPFSTGWFTVPTMSFFAQALSLKLFGNSVTGLRMLPAWLGTFTLLFTYLLARRTCGRTVALFALAALTFNHYHIHFSRLGSNQIADPFFMTLTLWLLTQGQASLDQADADSTRRSYPWFLAAGLIMGLSWYGYFGSRVIIVVVAVYLGWRIWSAPERLEKWLKPLALMLAIAFLVISPLLLYYLDHPQNLSARFNQVSYFNWRKIDQAVNPEHSELDRLKQQTWRAFSAFNHTLDPTFWYHPRIPLLDFVSGMLFILGLAIALARWRRWASRLILLWFALAVVFGWVLTENPPSSMRMTIVAPAVAMLVGLGLDWLLTLARRATGGSQGAWLAVGALALILIAVFNVHYYFGEYTPARIYGSSNAEVATELGRYLAGRTDDPEVYFYGQPFMYYDFGTIRFLARGVSGISVPPMQDQTGDFSLHVQGPTLFIFLWEREPELEAVQRQFPTGRRRDVLSQVNDRPLFIVYEVVQ